MNQRHQYPCYWETSSCAEVSFVKCLPEFYSGTVTVSESQMNRKLLFVVNVDWFFLSHRLPIALEAIRQGYEVHIATTLTDKITVLQDHGLVVHSLSLDRSGASLWTAIHEIWQIYRVFKDVNPDVVHLVTIKPVLFGGLAAVWHVPAVVAAISGLGFVFVAKGLRRQLGAG